MLTSRQPGTQGSNADYRLVVGGVTYGVDELPPNLSITQTGGSDGLSVGNCMGCTISGTLPYHNNSFIRNSPIYLYTSESAYNNGTPIYVWFLTDVTYLTDYSSFSFTGRDVIGFVDNPYEAEPQTGHDVATITQQVAAATTTIGRLCGWTVTIDTPNIGTVGALELAASKGWTIKQLLSYIAAFDRANYYMSMENYPTLRIKKINVNQSWSVSDEDDFAVIKRGINGQVITRVRAFGDGKKELPVYNSDAAAAWKNKDRFFRELKIFDITGQVTPSDAGTFIVETPLATHLSTIKSRVSDPDDPSTWVESGTYSYLSSTTYSGFVDGVRTFGTTFSCDAVKTDGFLIPMEQIVFGSASANEVFYYANNIKYSLTSEGMYAQISGGGKTLSDYEFLGTNEHDILHKVNIDTVYDTIKMTKGGLKAEVPDFEG